MSVGGGSQ